ncbi:MAG TPA: hypothetical protein VF780_10515, partial [Nitrosospira sp.]
RHEIADKFMRFPQWKFPASDWFNHRYLHDYLLIFSVTHVDSPCTGLPCPLFPLFALFPLVLIRPLHTGTPPFADSKIM